MSHLFKGALYAITLSVDELKIIASLLASVAECKIAYNLLADLENKFDNEELFEYVENMLFNYIPFEDRSYITFKNMQDNVDVVKDLSGANSIVNNGWPSKFHKL